MKAPIVIRKLFYSPRKVNFIAGPSSWSRVFASNENPFTIVVEMQCKP